MKILQACEISKKILDLISVLYINTRSQVIASDGMTECFERVSGVLQRDILIGSQPFYHHGGLSNAPWVRETPESTGFTVAPTVEQQDGQG